MTVSSSVRVATRAVIFDLDGVLVWTIPMHCWAFQQTFAREGKAFSHEDYMSLGLGASRDDVIRGVLGDVSSEKLAELMALKESYVREYLASRGIDAVPGAVAFVGRVRALELKTGVASASRTPRLLLESIGAADLFDAIVDRGMVSRSKPAPDVYLLTAEKLGVAPAECLVIEDSAIGIDAARAAGMRVLALTTTHARGELAGATAIYDSFPEIPLERWL